VEGIGIMAYSDRHFVAYLNAYCTPVKSIPFSQTVRSNSRMIREYRIIKDVKGSSVF
jgi:hypothetical protein